MKARMLLLVGYRVCYCVLYSTPQVRIEEVFRRKSVKYVFVEFISEAIEYGQQQLTLVGKVDVKRPHANSGFRCDIVRRRLLVAALLKQPDRRLNDLFSGSLAASLFRGCWQRQP